MRALVLMCLVACRSASQVPETRQGGGERAAPAAAPAGCQISLPPPPAGAPATVGPAYVLVDGVGVLRIADGSVTTAVAMPGTLAQSTVMATGPKGELWLSDWGNVRVLEPDGAIRALRSERGGPRYEGLVVRSASDVWAVTGDIDWAVVHHDGARWTAVRGREQFKGKYEDIKLNRMVVADGAVWVSTWNGLWRGVGDDWRPIALPDGLASTGDLWVYRDQLIAGDHGGHYLRVGEQWRELAWPLEGSVLRALSDIGVVAMPDLDSPTIRLSAVEGGGCVVTSEAVRGSRIDEFTVDAAGRSWVASDLGLAVLGSDGRLLAQWSSGSLPGLTGRIVAIAVAGRGPERLPAAQVGRSWEVVGRLETYKSGAPLAGLAIELCSARGRDGRCAGGTSVALRATTRADGSFRFAGVPEGEMHILVRPPEGLADCDTPFTVVGHVFAPARDCVARPDRPGVCDLGVLTQCLPFEMPPPPY
ncbi:MAG: carboxypeptidase regulatory-like domain-containing protein [Nannocystis sp.]|uniref:hypothetical protein n=1 Tax=Nannocystis sp. TaxID=1962667 RepID=UPI002429E106|nr:hypothetical protein [Nannocystis sp.]MBK9756390.1 carboxypeptidase regulatory-like domain-containing protein [Nannocystis sp.]